MGFNWMLVALLVLPVGCILCQQNQFYGNVFESTGKFLQNGAAINKGDLTKLIVTLSQVDQQQVIKLANQFLSNNQSNSTTLSDISGLLTDLQPSFLGSLLNSKVNISSLLEMIARELPINSSTSEPELAITGISETCRQHSQMVLDALENGELWSVKMVDAMGKMESGILGGRMGWLGSYDECLQVQASVKPTQNKTIHPFKGQYCLVGIPVGEIIKATVGDQGSMNDYFAFLGYGMCIPDSCNKTELLTAMNQVLPRIPLPQNKRLFAVYSMCQDPNREYDGKAIAAIVFCSILITVMTLATIYDVAVVQRRHLKNKSDNHKYDVVTNETSHELQNRTNQNTDHQNTEPISSSLESETQLSIPAQLLLSFSVYTNGKKLLNTNQSSGSITSVNGIRFLSMSWVILGHTYVFVVRHTGNIAIYSEEAFGRWTFTAISNALVSVDTFFALSGFLLSYLILKEMKKKNGVKGINWGLFYFHRFWRLTPAYMLTLFVVVSTYRYWGKGPGWPEKLGDEENCRKNWWTNLLYINNVVKTDEMCFGHSWYLANDMQFYIVSPLMFIPLFYKKILGFIVCGLFILATTISSGVVSSVHNLHPSSIGGGVPGVQHGNFMEEYYYKPMCRIGPFVVGIIGGYILFKLECKLQINKILNICIWLGTAAVACIIVYGLYGPLNGDYYLSNDVSALYNATHRTIWGICVCWVIIACATGNGGFVNTLLSWGAFVPLSRLTYCAYLIHPYIMIFYNDSIRQQIMLTDISGIYLFLGHLTLSYMVSFVLCLAFESPMMALEKILFGKILNKSKKKTPKSNEEPDISVIPESSCNKAGILDRIISEKEKDTFNEKL